MKAAELDFLARTAEICAESKSAVEAEASRLHLLASIELEALRSRISNWQEIGEHASSRYLVNAPGLREYVTSRAAVPAPARGQPSRRKRRRG